MPRYLNLVFQGGGVRGVAYAGALQGMPSDFRVHSVGGTSAGAIVAGLIATGSSPSQLKAILEDKQLFKFLDEVDIQRHASISAMVQEIGQCWDNKAKKLSVLKLGTVWWKHRDTLALAQDAWNDRGLYRSERLRAWLDQVLDGKCFKDIVTQDLRIVAADVSEQKYLVYTKQSYMNTPIAEAVHASVSIPIFFAPLRLGPRHLVDGGLLSNFPSFLFAQGQYPTVGFRLGEFDAPKQVHSSWDYLKSLFLTMAEAHDKERALPSHFKQYWIKTPADISSTKFDLSNADVDNLYEAGLKAGRTVDWQRYSATKPTVDYYDPKADLTLELSLKQAMRLADAYSQTEQWVDEAHFEMKLSARIERDWTVSYSRDTNISIAGATPLFFQRFSASADASSSSLFDTHFTADEVGADGTRKAMIRIPMYNREREKGYLIFFNSPVRPGETRLLCTSLKIPQEYATSLGAGFEDKISFLVRQIALRHTADLSFEILIDNDLPELALQSRFGPTFNREAMLDIDPKGCTYRKYTTRLAGVNILALCDFTVNIQPRF